MNDVSKMAASIGIELLNEAQKGWTIKCPNPEHSDEHPSAFLFRENGWVFCHACGYSRGLYSIAKDRGISVSGFQGSFYQKREEPKYEYKALIVSNMDAYPASTPTYTQGTFEYYEWLDFKAWIKQRRLSAEALDYAQALQWNQGILRYDGSLDGFEAPYKLAIPCCDDKGRLIGMEFRKYNNWDRHHIPKVQYNKDFQRRHFVWNMSEWDRSKPIYISEGIMDALRIFDCGTTNIGATYGAAVSKQQLAIIEQLIQPVWVADRDQAGLAAVLAVGAVNKRLKVLIPHGKDVGEGTEWEVQDAFQNRVIPFEEFRDEVDHEWFCDPYNQDRCQHIQYN